MLNPARLRLLLPATIFVLALAACSGESPPGGEVKTRPPVPQEPRELPVRLIYAGLPEITTPEASAQTIVSD